MRKSEPSAVNEAICDMLEVLHSAGKIDSETYREGSVSIFVSGVVDQGQSS